MYIIQFAEKVKATVEDNKFMKVINGDTKNINGTAGSIKFKVTITVDGDNIKGEVALEKAINLEILEKAYSAND